MLVQSTIKCVSLLSRAGHVLLLSSQNITLLVLLDKWRLFEVVTKVGTIVRNVAVVLLVVMRR